MSFVINTNVNSHLSTQHLNNYSRNMDSSVVSIATGKNINAVGDFLKGESIANSFLVQSSALQSNLATIRNGMSLAEKADKILGNSESMLQSMRELAIKSSNGTYLPRTGKALYSKAFGGFNVTAGSPGTFASGTITLTGATEGTKASGSLSFSGAHAGTAATASITVSGAVAGSQAANTLTISNAVDGTAAAGTIQITGGSAGGGNTIDSITLGGVNILSSAVAHTGNNNSTATNVAAAISASGYNASSSGSTITLTSTTKDEGQNGSVLAVSTSGNASTNTANISGAINASQTTINSLTVDGNNVLSGAPLSVTGGTSAIATAIRNAFSSGGHAASGSGANITITSNSKDASENGHIISLGMTNNAGATATSNTSGLSLTGGVTVSQTTISNLTVDGTNVLSGAPLSVTGGTSSIATAIRNAFSSSGHTVSGSGSNIVITSNTKDTGQNDDAVVLNLSTSSGATATSNADSGDGLTLSGGYTPTTTTITSVTVAGANGGNNLIDGSGSVTVTGNSNAIATAVAARLQSHTEFDSVFVSGGNNITFVSSSKLVGENGNAIGVSASHISGASTTTANGGNLAGGDDTSTNTISEITVNGVNILGANVVHNGGNSGTATSVKNAINSNSANSGYRAENSGATITITATDKDTTDNGYVIAMTRLNNGVVLNEVTQGATTNMSGGLTPNTNAFTNISVNGQKINGNIIAHTGNNTAAAAAIAADINATNTEVIQRIDGADVAVVRNYTATSSGAKVNIFSDSIPYWEDNGKSLTVTVRGDAATDNDNSASKMDGSVRQSGGAVVYINNEIKKIIEEVDYQLLNATHNEQALFTGNTHSFYTGINVENSIDAPTFTYTELDDDTLDLTVNSAETSLTYIDTNLENLKQLQSQYAAFANRLDFEIDYISNTLIKNSQTLSKIVDSEIAAETSQLMKYQFLEDAALSIYMQTRLQKRDVMNLYFSQSKVEGQGKFYF
ncbi:flagellin [Rhodobacteraceae bacterium]|nr:flagellin [Paracoccaceae bacterium]